MKNDLPSGRRIFNPLSATPAVEEQVQVPVQHREQESTSAMSHDADDQCPKCSRKMQPAKTPIASVYFCDSCRVAHPMRA